MRNRWVATHMPTTLQGISNRARGNKQAQFGGLYRLLNVENLRWCFYQLRKTAAVGVDKVSFYDYEQNLDENLNNLVDKLKAKSYHANLIRRKHIPKGNCKTRALGIPTLEDKLLQLACAKVLTAIYENHFLDCSWGYRPRRGGKEASYRLSMELYDAMAMLSKLI
jgi:RNA-directed DNA polymerase